MRYVRVPPPPVTESISSSSPCRNHAPEGAGRIPPCGERASTLGVDHLLELVKTPLQASATKTRNSGSKAEVSLSPYLLSRRTFSPASQPQLLGGFAPRLVVWRAEASPSPASDPFASPASLASAAALASASA